MNIWMAVSPRVDSPNKGYPKLRRQGTRKRQLLVSGMASGLRWPQGPGPGWCSLLLTGAHVTC